MICLNFLSRSTRLINFKHSKCITTFLIPKQASLDNFKRLHMLQRNVNNLFKNKILITSTSCNQMTGNDKTLKKDLVKLPEDKEVKLTNKEKLKRAISAYGSTVIIFHVTISLFSLGMCYSIVASGLDVQPLLEYLNLGVASHAGTFVIAYGIHKVLAPARITITLTATPFIVKYLRRVGILKRAVPKNS